MRKKTAAALLVAVVASLGVQAQPKPTYEQARKITDGVMKTINVVMLWEKKTQAERMQAMRAARELVKQGEQVFGSEPFGPWSQCYLLVSQHLDFVQTLNAHARALETGDGPNAFALNASLRNAFELGDRYRVCRELSETLDVRR